MEEKFNQYIEARFTPGSKRGTSGVINAAFAEKSSGLKILIQANFPRNLVS